MNQPWELDVEDLLCRRPFSVYLTNYNERIVNRFDFYFLDRLIKVKGQWNLTCVYVCDTAPRSWPCRAKRWTHWAVDPERCANGESHFHNMGRDCTCSVVCVYKGRGVCLKEALAQETTWERENMSPVCVHVCVLMRKAECLSVGRKEGICIALNEPEMCVRRILRGWHLFWKLRQWSLFSHRYYFLCLRRKFFVPEVAFFFFYFEA